MYRKILVICILVFMVQISITVQALTVTVVLSVFLYIQYEFKPYRQDHLNHMEMETILTATVTIYCGLYYLDNDDIGDVFKGVLFFFILFGNVYFVCYWLFYMFQAIIDMLSNSIHFLKKLTGNLDSYPQIVT